MRLGFSIEYGVVKFILSTIFEALVVLAILMASLLVDSYARIVLPGYGTLDRTLWEIIFSQSVFASLFVTVTYRLAKSTWQTIFRKSKRDYSLLGFFLNIFMITALILALMPMRPIFEKAIQNGESPYVRGAYVKFEAKTAMLILLMVGLPTMWLIVSESGES